MEPRRALLLACLAGGFWPAVLSAQFPSSGVTKLAQIGPGATGFENFPPSGDVSPEMGQVQAPFSGVTGGRLFSKREFAVCCAYNGILFLETEDPSQDRKYFFPDGPVSTHRGVATYGRYVYAISSKSTGIRVFNVTDEDGVFSVTIIKSSAREDYHNRSDLNGLLASPRLTIDQDRGHLYVCSPEAGDDLVFRRVKVFSIDAATGTLNLMRVLDGPSDEPTPAFGVFLRRLPSGETWAYISSYALPLPRRIHIVDVTNIATQDPMEWASVEYPPAFEPHSSWVTDDGSYLFESVGDSFVTAHDISSIAPAPGRPTSPNSFLPVPDELLTPKHFPPQESFKLHHFEGIGNTGYASTWKDGFWLTHIVRLGDPLTSPPTAIKKIAVFDTQIDAVPSPNDPAPIFKGVWGVYPHQDSGIVYASDRQSGLFALQVDVGHLNRFGQATLHPTGGAPLRITTEHAPTFVTEVGLPSIELTIRNIPSGEKIALESTLFGALETPVNLNGETGPTVNKWIVSMLLDPEACDPPTFFKEISDADGDGVEVVTFPPLVNLPVGTRIYCQAYSYTGSFTDPMDLPRYTGASRGTWFGLAPRELQ